MKNPFNRNAGSKNSAADTVSAGEVALVTNRLKAHFVNNILSSIYYLCDSDPQRAQSVTMNLSGYMLAALGTLESSGNIPFSGEMDMVRNYIALERLRFEDKLSVQYEIDTDDFRIPPLIIQSLVENSVKHGIAEKNAPGRVKVETRRLPDNLIRISVTDNGVGFDVSEKMTPDSELSYISDLVKRELNGEMSVKSSPGEGTTVTITFRKELS